MAAWKLPVIVAALAVPIVAAFAFGGAAAGVAAGALMTAALLVVAARQKPRGPIGGAAGESAERKVLLVVTRRVDEPAEVREVAAAAELGPEGDEANVLVLSPVRTRFLDRWASDVEGARRSAQEDLVATVAALAKAGIAAEARVGDEDVVQAVEDQLGSFAASEVVLVSSGGDAAVARAAELEERLRPAFRHVVLDGG